MIRQITVVNESKGYVKVMLQSERKHLLTFKNRKISDESREEFFNLVMEGKIGIPLKVAEITAEGKDDLTWSEKVRKFLEEEEQGTFETNGFIQEGFEKIVSGDKRKFSIDTTENVYYISYILEGEEEIRGPIPKADDTIIIKNSGIFEVEPIAPEIIKKGDRISLQLEDGHFVANPVVDEGWFASVFAVNPGGVLGQVNRETPAPHTLHPIDDNVEVIKANDVIRIRTTDTSVADSRNNMRGIAASNKVYYDNFTDGEDKNRQTWRIEKVGGSGEIKDGDKVKLVNLAWSDHVLTYNETSGYLAIYPDFGRDNMHKVWIIRKSN